MIPTLPQIRAAFERFKDAYPKRPENGWAPALVAFEKLGKAGADLDMIVQAASAYAVYTAASIPDPKFIPMAKRWLSERRFEDFQEAPASASAPSPEPPVAHPLARLQAHVPETAWRSWFAPLDVVQGDEAITITAATQFAADHVRSEWGHLIRRHYGVVVFAVQQRTRS